MDTKSGKWKWPSRKDKFARYREINAAFKRIFLKGLEGLFARGELVYHADYAEVASWVEDKAWVVHNTAPAADPKVISEYLGRYVARVGVSKNRLKLDRVAGEVLLEYNDYRRQEKGQPAPKAYKKMAPLVAIGQILQHVLPLRFQKARHYGLHHASTRKKWAGKLAGIVKKEGATVRTLFQILKAMLGYEVRVCRHCGSVDDFDTAELSPDEMRASLGALKNKSPPPDGGSISN